MEQYYLAIDIGASSGRHILGHMEDGKMVLEEMYRFPNGMTEENGQKSWNVKALFRAILEGMKKCKEAGKIPVSMGIDTWAVDFVLLDKKNKMLGDAVGYRDSRTAGMDEKVYEIIPEAGVRISKIKNLEDDIALSLSALQIRIIAPMPGKGTIGIEVPNNKPQTVSMQSVVASRKFQECTYDLPVAI